MAVAELTKKANLTGSQALVNVTVKNSAKLFLVYGKVTYIAEGTVIEFEEYSPPHNYIREEVD